jgi:quercetin dioxygenase-like cupin family protein
MNRREVLSSIPALAATALALKAVAQSGQQITHVDAKTTGALLQSSVVEAESLPPEGSAPGAKAYVSFNGPTEQLAALATGYVTLEPGAQPHPPHRHAEEEIMIVGEGSGQFYLNEAATPVKPGDMLFAESNMLHGVRNTGQTRMTFYFLKIMGKNAS